MFAFGARVDWILDRGELGKRESGQSQQDYRGAHSPADLKARVAVNLGCHGALARADAEQGVAERPLDQHEDHERHIQRDLVEAVDLIGVGGPARLGGEEREGCGKQMTQGGRDSIQERTERACPTTGTGANGFAKGAMKLLESYSTPRKIGRTLCQEGADALNEIIATGHLLLKRRLQLKLLSHVRVQLGIEQTLVSGIGARRPGGQACR